MAGLRASGEQQGRGAFTLDAARARRLLASYRLAEPHEYGLFVVQAAVRGEAREVLMTQEGWLTRFFLSGLTLDAFTLENLPDSLLAPGPEGPLSMALLLAERLSPREMRLQSGDLELRLQGGQRSLKQARESLAGLALEVDRDPGRWQRALGASPSDLEAQSLRIACAQAPIPVSVGGASARTPVRLDSSLAAMVFEHPGYDSQKLPLKLPSGAPLQHHPSPGDFAAALGLVSDDQPAWTFLVVEGLFFEGPRREGLQAVLWTNALKVNLSLGAVVQDQTLERFLELLSQGLEHLKESLWGEIEQLSQAGLAYLEKVALRPSAHLPLATLEDLIRALKRSGSENAELNTRAAELALMEKQLDRAESYYRRALELSPEREAYLKDGLLKVLRARGLPPRELEDLFREVIFGLRKRVVGLGRRDTLATYFEEIGHYADSIECRSEARDYYTQALRLREGMYGSDHHTVIKLKERLAELGQPPS